MGTAAEDGIAQICAYALDKFLKNLDMIRVSNSHHAYFRKGLKGFSLNPEASFFNFHKSSSFPKNVF